MRALAPSGAMRPCARPEGLRGLRIMRKPTAALLALMLSSGLAPARGGTMPSPRYASPSPPQYAFTQERARIPMRDGVTLAVTLYRPRGAPRGSRFPVILNYLPYRKDDDEAPEQYGIFSYFARRGFVGAAVDIRGFGESGGTPPDR